MALRISNSFGSPRLGAGRVGAFLGEDRITAPWIEIVTNKSTGNISGQIRPPPTFGLGNGQGRFRVRWWDGTQTESTGSAATSNAWSKAAGGAGEKTIRFYPITQDSTQIARGDITLFSAIEQDVTAAYVRGSLGLRSLGLSKNLLTAIDVSGCDNLEFLDLTDNQITSLDVSGQTKLDTLIFPANNVSSIDLSGLSLVTFFSCYGNPIESIDFSDQPLVDSINVRDCLLSASALNGLYASLPDRSGMVAGVVCVGGNPGYEDPEEDQSIATDKNWTITSGCTF
jgi:hypothetical protein